MKVEELQNSLEEDVQRINERRWWKDSRTSSAGSTISRIKVQVNGTRKEKANDSVFVNRWQCWLDRVTVWISWERISPSFWEKLWDNTEKRFGLPFFSAKKATFWKQGGCSREHNRCCFFLNFFLLFCAIREILCLFLSLFVTFCCCCFLT